jgi:hypothetical protein
MGGHDQVLGTDELNAYLSKYRLELDPHLEALVGRSVLKLSQLILLAWAGIGRVNPSNLW